MKKYEGLRCAIDELLGDFTGRDLDKALTLEEFNSLLDINMADQWNNGTNWESNEYGTQDFTFSIDTKSEEDEEITLMVSLEVKDNLITHIVNVEEYCS